MAILQIRLDETTSQNILLIKDRVNSMINTKAIIYSSIAATLLAGNAAQAQLTQGELPAGKPTSIMQSGSVTRDGVTVGFDYNLYALEVDGSDVYYDILGPFYVNFEAPVGQQVVQGPAPTSAMFDYVQYNSLYAVLDPSGSFDASFRDFGGPSNFTQTFTFSSFEPTITGLVNFSGSLSGGMTDLAGNGVSITPYNQASTVLIKLYDINNNLISTLGRGDTASGSGLGAAASYGYGPFNSAPSLANCGTAGCGKVEIELSFTGSGGGDSYALTGGYFVEPVPEPLTILGAGAAVGFGGLFKRKLAQKKNTKA
ncbi:PEP-CTERM sorting domain-containing protein [Crocosphaera sp. UHCC 0190]|uniref:PEP-CTERM sorting domain-containing protein n=1 Tax=Crocosphaera sp. UHCC 0190 TaxID=3110246 RepID=UPI003A520C5C